jgi:hypothetical protein
MEITLQAPPHPEKPGMVTNLKLGLWCRLRVGREIGSRRSIEWELIDCMSKFLKKTYTPAGFEPVIFWH